MSLRNESRAFQQRHQPPEYKLHSTQLLRRSRTRLLMHQRLSNLTFQRIKHEPLPILINRRLMQQTNDLFPNWIPETKSKSWRELTTSINLSFLNTTSLHKESKGWQWIESEVKLLLWLHLKRSRVKPRDQWTSHERSTGQRHTSYSISITLSTTITETSFLFLSRRRELPIRRSIK